MQSADAMIATSQPQADHSVPGDDQPEALNSSQAGPQRATGTVKPYDFAKSIDEAWERFMKAWDEAA